MTNLRVAIGKKQTNMSLRGERKGFPFTHIYLLFPFLFHPQKAVDFKYASASAAIRKGLGGCGGGGGGDGDGGGGGDGGGLVEWVLYHESWGLGNA
jgi:hypothetical protein